MVSNQTLEISVILPVYNEAENLRGLHDALQNQLCAMGVCYEILYCDDGSTDGGTEILRELAAGDSRVRVLIFRRNFGQTAAISAGVDQARGKIILLMDADRQNDPADIPRVTAKLLEGFDIVSGWRRDRKDARLTRILPSRIANWLISRITGVKLHDHGCTLKAYRREVFEHVSLYGEMHRFIPILGYWQGARVTEIEVRHHPRCAGKSKYSLLRVFKVLLDLPLLVLLGNYMTRPMHFFGMVGIGFNFAAFLCGLRLAKDVFVDGEQASDNGFLVLSAFFCLIGIQIIMIGLVAELIARVYFESQGKKTYVIREIINQPDSERAFE